jgi:transposase
MHVCVVDHAGEIVFDRSLATRPEVLLRVLKPYRDGLVIGVECMFAWYWVADFCVAHDIPFVLGHALYLKAVHGGKAKNDRIDATKLARLLRGGNFPTAYAYPKGMRETRDLLRRRTYLVRKRAELLTHLQILNAQYNLTPFAKKLCYATNRAEMKIADRFPDASVQKNAAANLAIVERLDTVIADLEQYLTRTAKIDSLQTNHRLQTIPGVGKLLALILLYEMHDVQRFERVGQFLSYARLVRCAHESGGKKLGTGGKKIGPSTGSSGRRPSAAVARRWRSWRHGWRGRCTTCCVRGRPSTRNASGQGARGQRLRVPLLCSARRRSMPALDYREARARLQLAEVLALLGFQPSSHRGDQVRGPCPVHRLRRRTSRSFAAQLRQQVWHCFGCGAGGNALDLWMAVTRQPLHAAVIDLYTRLGREVPWLRQARAQENQTMPEP